MPFASRPVRLTRGALAIRDGGGKNENGSGSSPLSSGTTRSGDGGGPGLGTALAVAAAMLGVFALSRYQRCSPNEVIVVFGLTGSKKAKLVHGGGTFVWPIIQEFRTLQLEPFAVEVPLEKALSLEKVRVSVPSVFTLAVGTEVCEKLK